MKSLFATCVLACLSSPLMAQSYDAAPVVQASASPGSAARIAANMDVAASPAVVFATLRDCENAPAFMPKLISCKVLSKGSGDAWEIREHRLRGGLFKPQMRNVFRVDFDAPRSLRFHRVAGDWKISQGEWTITPLAGGRGAHVDYHTEVAVGGPVPVSMVRSAIAKGMPEAMLALRRECVARARGEPPS